MSGLGTTTGKQHHGQAFEALIALGSNLGDRDAYLSAATSKIAALGNEILAKAPRYATDPIGAADQIFLNSALLIRTHRSPHDLLNDLLQVETELGRVRSVHWGNRTIDLDILMMRDATGEQIEVNARPTLVIPHPEMLKRDFVMQPAADIAPEWVHPQHGRTIAAEFRAQKHS